MLINHPPILSLGQQRAGLLLVVLVVLLLEGCSTSHSTEPTSTADDHEPAVVAVIKAQLQPWERTVLVHGTLAPDETAVLGAKVAGRVGEVLVDVGDLVEAGQPLVKLDDRQLQLELRHAETLLAQACAAIGLTPEESTDSLVPENSPVVRQEKAVLDQAALALERARALAERDAATQEHVDETEAAYKVAAARHAAALNSLAEKIAIIAVRRAEVDVAQNALVESTILAPFAGVIQEKSTAAGAYLRAGDPVATVLRCDRLRFVGAVPEKDAHWIRPGHQVRLRLRGESDFRTVQVSRFRPLIDPLARALTFEADVRNTECQLRPGLFAEAEVIVDPDAQALVLPASAVTEFAGVEKVWRVIDGQAEETTVQTGDRRDDRVAITSGVSAGDVIVSNPAEARSGKVIIQTANTES